MSKVNLGTELLLYPMPAVLVGAKVDGKPNFLAAAWCGVVNSEPPMISIALRHPRHTLKGVRQNQAFSINVPSTDLVKETDFCGTQSGAKVDKVAICDFKVFYGVLQTAPLIEQCPANMECRVAHMLDLGSHVLVIGRVEASYITDSCLTNGIPDVRKIQPLTYVRGTREYIAPGETVGKAYEVGQALVKPK